MSKTSSRLALRGERIRRYVTRQMGRIGFKEEYFLILVAILIGTLTGFLGNVFYQLLEYSVHFTYGDGEGSDQGLYGGRAWMLIVLPAVGGLLVGFITYFFAREAKGHGVPEVMDAIYRKNGVIRPRVAVAKTICSALTIGSGGSAGTEGPIIQIGAAIGSTFGQFLNVGRRNMGVFVACGAAAGISAIFNAPIAGVLFALEIFLKDFSLRTFSPVVIASVMSLSVMHALRGEDRAIFEIVQITGENFGNYFVVSELPYYLVLGVLCAVAGVLFIRALYKAEDFTEIVPIPEPLKPAIGAILLGLAGASWVWFSKSNNMPFFFANGYPVIEKIINPDTLATSAVFLLGIYFLKVLATCFTLGSGGSGGVFAPSLMMGAAIGGAFGIILFQLGLIQQKEHMIAFAVVGMSATVAGTTHAPMTAIVVLWELTRESKIILPIMFAAIVATTFARYLCRDSIYTLKLRRRGVRLGTLADITILKRITADQVMPTPAQFVHPEDQFQKLLKLAEEAEAPDFVVVDDDSCYCGLVVAADIKTALLQPEAVPLLVVGELVRENVPTVRPDETLDIVMDKFAHCDLQSLPMTSIHDPTHIEAIITRQAVMRRYQEELESQEE